MGDASWLGGRGCIATNGLLVLSTAIWIFSSSTITSTTSRESMWKMMPTMMWLVLLLRLHRSSSSSSSSSRPWLRWQGDMAGEQ